MSMTFYYSPMSSATRVHWALEELGVPYEKVRVNLAEGEQRRPEYLKLNPNGKIPLLVVDGLPIFESLAQLLYLGETYGEAKGLFPKPGLARAEAFKWMCWVSVSMHDAIVRIIKNGERVPEEERNPKARAAAIKEVGEYLGVLDAHLAGKSWVAGTDFTVADISLAVVTEMAFGCGLDVAKFPNIKAWFGRISERDSWRKASG